MPVSQGANKKRAKSLAPQSAGCQKIRGRISQSELQRNPHSLRGVPLALALALLAALARRFTLVPLSIWLHLRLGSNCGDLQHDKLIALAQRLEVADGGDADLVGHSADLHRSLYQGRLAIRLRGIEGLSPVCDDEGHHSKTGETIRCRRDWELQVGASICLHGSLQELAGVETLPQTQGNVVLVGDEKFAFFYTRC